MWENGLANDTSFEQIRKAFQYINRLIYMYNPWNIFNYVINS